MKILHFIYGLSLGGAESFIRSCMQSFVKDDVEWHFALQNPEITIFFSQKMLFLTEFTIFHHSTAIQSVNTALCHGY